MGNTEYYGMEKRKHARTIYPTAKQPIFRARGEKLKIKDVSRGGLKFCNRDKVKIQGWVEGTIDLADGTCIKVEGIIVRVEDDGMGLSFIGDLEDDVYHKIPLTSQPPAH